MISMYKQDTNDIDATATLSNFYPCVANFIDIMDRENACIKEHDITSLNELLPLKKECNDRYEKITDNINQLISSQALSKDELAHLSKINNEFIKKSKENYSYLNNAHEYSQRLMNIYIESLNQVNKYTYTDKGESRSAYSRSQPIALSQTF